MTPLQFARRRKKLFRTQLEASEALGVGVAAISHYEVGRRPIPKTIIKLLTCLELKTHPTD